MSSRILIIDDEPQIQRFLQISLKSQGYDIVSADTGNQGIAQAGLSKPDIIILDLGLPDKDGQQVLKEIREFSKVPIIVLSVRASEIEKVRALDAGAEDYVVKPFGVNELLARIRRILKNALPENEHLINVYDDGYLRVEPIKRLVYVNADDVHFSPKEYSLLMELIQHRGRIVTQQQLLERVWGASHKRDSHYLRIIIGRLRTKLGDDASSPKYIETEPGVGYRFIGEG